MIFSEKQSNEINEFIMRYNTDEEFKNNIQQLYDNNKYRLSILQIYALEEVLRYGAKDIFSRFLKTKGTYSLEQAIDLFDGFIKLFNEDENFKQHKMQQLKDTPETLSTMEMLAFTIISSSNEQKEKMHDEMTEELEYDSYNPILYSTDKQIKETLLNLFFGELVFRMLELPNMKSVKVRQKKNGIIANIDKQVIIERVRPIVLEQEFRSQLSPIIYNRFVEVKWRVLSGKGELAFGEYLKFNTNISSREILGVEKDYSEPNIHNFQP